GPVASFRYDEARVGGELTGITGTNLVAAEHLFDFGISSGLAVEPTISDPVLISDEVAASESIRVGDIVSMTFGGGVERDLTVIGVYEDDVIVEEGYLLDLATWVEVGAESADAWIGFSLADGVTPSQAAAALAPIAEAYPMVTVATASEFVDSLEGMVDQALATINVMVALAVIIALIGIANTLALSVFERTRELGLLRAVGMSRRQLRTMIRLEAALVALLGAVLGVSVGILFGWAAVVALPASITSTLAVPTTRILILVTVAGVAGLVAAWGPARRAGRLDVLDAIAN
ncbi:MAG: ABC transporter permease, partial [Actinomycetia bacterium]|nr:ABC transporter permease [Actinomycetes bacterium]